MNNKGTTQKGGQSLVLLFSIFLAAASSFFYEFLISTLSSYFLGNAVFHFSITIGFFLCFIGVGSYLSQFFHKNLERTFVIIELLIALIGGLSVILLYLAFTYYDNYYVAVFLLISSIGILTGFEIPFLTRIAEKEQSVQKALANILSWDYLGALAASLLFPLLMLPTLGLMKTSLLIGLFNLGVATIFLSAYWNEIKNKKPIFVGLTTVFLILVGGFVQSEQLVSIYESKLYQDDIIYSEQSAYQNIVLTKYKEDYRLFLNGSLQFSSEDEYRYHEPLVHIPFAITPQVEHVLILGGGDGMVAREILKHDEVKTITLVDLDEAVTNLAQENLVVTELNQDSLLNEKITIINQDAFTFIGETDDIFDLIIIDLPDPSTLSLGKLYSIEFYYLLNEQLSETGAIITQASSPYFVREAYWSIHTSMKEVFGYTLPLNNYVPSFGPWGYIIGMKHVPNIESVQFHDDLHYLNTNVFNEMQTFDNDMAKIEVDANYLDQQSTVNYYQQGWENHFQLSN